MKCRTRLRGTLGLTKERLLKTLTDETPQSSGPPEGRGPFLAIVRGCRPQHWIKNVLLLLPLVLSHDFQRAGVWAAAACAFISFSLAASAVYLFNDVMDHSADRLHPVKRLRPIAAGQLQPREAILAALMLLGLAAAAAHRAGGAFQVLFWSYLVATTAYSLGLKRILLVDALLLALFYVLRLYAGSLATETPVSRWLLCFSLFFFLGLAFQKRVAELLDWSGSPPAVRHRGYHLEDVAMVTNLGISSSFLAVVVLALYIQSPEVSEHYHLIGPLWAVLPLLLYWVSRLWVLTGRRQIKEDAIAFALRDTASYAVLALIVGFILLARPY